MKCCESIEPVLDGESYRQRLKPTVTDSAALDPTSCPANSTSPTLTDPAGGPMPLAKGWSPFPSERHAFGRPLKRARTSYWTSSRCGGRPLAEPPWG